MSFSSAPCLDVSILVITGRRMNSINLLIDHVWSCPNVLSKNISFLVSISLGQCDTRCIKVSSLSSHSLQNLEMSIGLSRLSSCSYFVILFAKPLIEIKLI